MIVNAMATRVVAVAAHPAGVTSSDKDAISSRGTLFPAALGLRLSKQGTRIVPSMIGRSWTNRNPGEDANLSNNPGPSENPASQWTRNVASNPVQSQGYSQNTGPQPNIPSSWQGNNVQPNAPWQDQNLGNSGGSWQGQGLNPSWNTSSGNTQTQGWNNTRDNNTTSTSPGNESSWNTQVASSNPAPLQNASQPATTWDSNSGSENTTISADSAKSQTVTTPMKIYRDEDGWPSPLLDPDYKPSEETFAGSFRSSSFGKGVGKVWPNPNYKPKPGDNYVWSTGGSSFSKYGSGKTWPNPNYKPKPGDNFVTFTKGSGKVWPNPNYKPQPGEPKFVTGTGKGGTGKVWPNPNYKGDDPTYVWGGGGKGSGKTWPNPNYKGPPPIYDTGKGKGGGKVWPNPDYKGPPVGPEFAGIGRKGGKVWPNPNYKGDDPTYVSGGRGSGKTWPNPNYKPLQPAAPGNEPSSDFATTWRPSNTNVTPPS